MTSKEDIKKEFDEFAQKVGQLEAFRQELENLNTKGFETEVKLIKAKLKNVNAIPEIRKDLDELHHKISRKSSASIEKSVVDNKLLKDSKALKEETEELKNKINKLEKTIDERKKLSVKKSLTGKQESYLKDIPKLEEELRALRTKFDEHTKYAKMKIDSGVGVLVDTKFDDFVNGLKGELTERLQEKEMTMDSELRTDLEQREKVFAGHYRALVQEFQERYRNRVENQLKKEVSEKFQDELQRALAKERREIVDALVKEHAVRLHADKARLVIELQTKYENQEKKFENNLNRSMEKDRQEISKKRFLLGKKIESIKKEEAKVAREKEESEKLIEKYEKEKKTNEEESERLGKLLSRHKSELARLLKVKNRIKKTRKEISAEKNKDRSHLDRIVEEERKISEEEKEAIREHAEARKLLKAQEKREVKFNSQNRKDLIRHRAELGRLLKLKNRIKKSMLVLQGEQRKRADYEAEVNAKAEMEARKKIISYVEQNNKEFSNKVNNLKSQFNRDLGKSIEKQRKKDKFEFLNTLQRKEIEVKNRLEKEYENKMKQELRTKERDMEQKKKEFEAHVMEQAKKLFH